MTCAPGTARWATALVVALAIAVGALLQAQVQLGPDLGWLLRSARLMLEGRRFGVDIFEPNLPVAWYLSMPAALAVDHLGIAEVTAIRAWTWVLAGIGLVTARACLLGAGDASGRALAEFAAAAIAACILVGGSFGQREHLAFALSLPYLTCARLRWDGRPPPAPPALMAGALAGIAFAIKPVFVLVPAIVESSAYAFGRGQWRLLRRETLAMAAVGVAVAAAVLAFAPAYLERVVPAAFATYWAYDSPLVYLVDDYPVLPWVFVAWLAAALSSRSVARASLIWFAAFAAWSLGYFLQGKGFDYHGFPAMACALVLTAGALAMLGARLRAASVAACAVLLLAAGLVAADAWRWFRDATDLGSPQSRATVRRELVATLGALGVGPGVRVFSFSTNPYPAFPALNYLGAEWVGPDMAQFLLPAWVRRNEVQDESQLMAIDAAMALQRRHVRLAVLEGRPQFILVNNRSRSASPGGVGAGRIDYLAIFGTDPELAEAFARYRRVAKVGAVQVLALEAPP